MCFSVLYSSCLEGENLVQGVNTETVGTIEPTQV